MACVVASSMAVAMRPVAVSKASKATSFKAVTVSNGTVKKTTANMKVWTPINNKFFETFSFLPPLSDGEITKQVDYIVRNSWTPCLEFSAPEAAYISSDSCERFGAGASVNYFDNRYWSMWKLPMFGCTDGSQVLAEINACTKAFPGAYIRLVAFDNQKQVQCAGFLVHRPAGASEFQAPDQRSV